MPIRDQVIDSLRAVIDPELRRDIVELEMVRSIDVHENGVVDVMVSLTTPGCPIRSHFQTGVADAVRALDGVTGVNVSFDVLSDDEKQRARSSKLGRGSLPDGRAGAGQERDLRRLGQGRRRQVERHRQPRRGAGGRGQAGRRARRRRVGLLAAAHVRPRRERPHVNAERKIIPLEAHDGIKVMSIGFFVEQDAAVVWRGPMLHKALQQFLEDVDWGELDYLLIDLPPGHRRRLDDARPAAARRRSS